MENCEMGKVVRSIQEYLNAGRKEDRKRGHSPALLINVEFSNREAMEQTKDPNKKCWISTSLYLWNILADKQGEKQFCPSMRALGTSIPCQETWALLQHPYKKMYGFLRGFPLEFPCGNSKTATICGLSH